MCQVVTSVFTCSNDWCNVGHRLSTTSIRQLLPGSLGTTGLRSRCQTLPCKRAPLLTVRRFKHQFFLLQEDYGALREITASIITIINMAKDPESLLVATLQAAAQNWRAFDWNGKVQQWDVSAAQTKEARELSLAARKQLADDTKQFKKSVKNVETAGTNLQASNTEETATATIKAIDALAKSCRVTIKAYQGKETARFSPNKTWDMELYL